MRGPMLPYRPDPFEGESWPGYLLRLANSNGLRGLVSIASLLNMTTERLLRANILEVGNWLNLTEPLGAEPGGNAYRGHLNMRTRVCPDCLKEDRTPFLRAAWDSPIKLHCDNHRKLLLDTCPVCSQHLTYERGWVSSCGCGAQLKGLRTTRSEAWMMDMYELVQATKIVGNPRRTFSETGVEEHQKADLLMRMTHVQKPPGRPGKQKRVSRHKFVARADVEWLKEIFGQGSESLHASMAKWQLSGVRLGQLRLPVGSPLYEIWSKISVDQRRTRASLRAPPSQVPLGFVSKRRLMNEMGLHPTAIDYLIDTGLIRGAVKMESASAFKARYLIPEAEYQGLLALHKGTMSIHESAEFALVRPSTIRILGYSGAIQTFRLGKCKYVFRIKATDLAAAMQRVLSRARRSLGPIDSLVPLEDAITELYRFDLRLPRLLLDDVGAGQVQMLVLNRSALHLGECYLDSGAFLEWCRMYKPAGAFRVNKVPG